LTVPVLVIWPGLDSVAVHVNFHVVGDRVGVGHRITDADLGEGGHLVDDDLRVDDADRGGVLAGRRVLLVVDGRTGDLVGVRVAAVAFHLALEGAGVDGAGGEILRHVTVAVQVAEDAVDENG
jgi:hypothetical protein